MKLWGMNMNVNKLLRLACILGPLSLATACASANAPDGRSVSVPTINPPLERYEGLNEKRDPITRVKLGRDLLMPQPLHEDPLPNAKVGPFELRNETLASALQLILDDYDVSLAFETDDGLKKRITISNLRGTLSDVVHKACATADLYCHYEDGTLTVKKTETFVVDLPPITNPSSSNSNNSNGGGNGGGGSSGNSGNGSNGSSSTNNDAYDQIATGLAAVLGSSTKPTIDNTTRVLIYTATQRTNKYALQYFERLRKDTALIIYETHIWEVTLNNDNRTGINWSQLFGKMGYFSVGSTLADGFPSGTTQPITLEPKYVGSSGTVSADVILKFISDRGAVKTVSQPQITVLSGSKATLAVSQLDNYISGSSKTAATPTTAEQDTFTTGTVTTGLTMTVTSAWDQATVYGTLDISLDDLLRIDTISTTSSTIQLPHTTKRSLQTQIRVRPGDAILIGGLVSEKDNLSESGPGLNKPWFFTDRGASKTNTELVFLLRPRVVAFTMGGDEDTPQMVDAPKDGQAAPNPSPSAARKLFNKPALAKKPAQPASADDGKAPLPAGISPEAFAPQGGDLQTLTPQMPPVSQAAGQSPPPTPAHPAAQTGKPQNITAPGDDLPASLQDQAPPAAMLPATGDGKKSDTTKKDGAAAGGSATNKGELNK